MASPREVIEQIRRERFGIGLPPGSPERNVIDQLRPMLDRAIQHLSEDLYAKDIHFVLELVQNADDNSYRPDVVPLIRFIRSRDCLVVQNNETGFEETHVRALCDIGASSKSKAAGFIGEKGIGFKSVFRVSDQPHVISNGYSFRFRRHDPEIGLGFIVPEWVDDIPDFVDPALTSIVLPLRPQARDEVHKLEQIGASILLFLKKLRTIEFVDEENETTIRFERRGQGGRIELLSDAGREDWRLVSTSVEVPPGLSEEKRKGITESEVVLAFPLTAEGAADASHKWPVHAFLPVHEYGLRFVVQADFLLASSREVILADRPWNHWLREQIAPLFIRAVEDAFKCDEGELRTTFLAYVPHQGAAKDPFAPVPEQIHDALRETECILTASGTWAKPGQVVHASERLQSLIPNEDVQQLLGREYMATQFKIPDALLKRLGGLVFNLPELLQCLGATDWLTSKPDTWFASLFAYLAALDLKQGIDKLKPLTILPLEGGGIGSAAEGRVFFPLAKETSYGFENRIRLVRRTVFEGLDEATASAAKRFLKSLGVKKADPGEIVAEYILPAFAGSDPSDSWKQMDDDFRIGSVEYIKDHLEEYLAEGRPPARLTAELYLKFVHPENRWYSRPDHLYVSEVYGNPNGLETLLHSIEGVQFVDPVYLERSMERLARRWKKPLDSAAVQLRRRREARAWRNFFLRLGLVETIRVVHQPTGTHPNQADSPHLAQLLGTQDAKRITRVVHLLDSNWSYYRERLLTDFRRAERGRWVCLGKTKTEFGDLLAQSRWIPVQDGTLSPPGDVFLDLPQTRDLLGGSVPYLAVDIKTAEMLDDLDIRREPTVQSALARLREIAQNGLADAPAVRRLYEFLDHRFDEGGQEILDAFSAEALFCIPTSPPRYLTLCRVFWQDASSVFGMSRGSLCRYWPNLRQFFVTKLNMPLLPSAEDYANLLRELSEKGSLSTQQEKVVWTVYKELNRHLENADEPEEITGQSWWQELVRAGVFWTDKGEFWANEGDLFVNDRDDLYQHLKDRPDVAFLKLPDREFPRVLRFIRAAGVPLLSEVVEVEHVTPQEAHEHGELTARCRLVIPYVRRYLYFREREFYDKKKVSGELAGLDGLVVTICDEQFVSVSLRGASVRLRREIASRFPRVFVSRRCQDDLDEIAGELARMLGGSEELAMFIIVALDRRTPEDVEKLMRARNIPRLPAAEENGAAETAGAEQPGGEIETATGGPTVSDDGGESIQEADGGTAWDSEDVQASEGDDEESVPDAAGSSDETASWAEAGARIAARVTGPGGGEIGDGPVGMRPDPGREGKQVGGEGRPPDGTRHPAPTRSEPRPAGQPAGESFDSSGDWVSHCQPNQVRVCYTDVEPPPRADRPGGVTVTFGSGGGVPRQPGHAQSDDVPTRNPHAVPIGKWGEEYALFCLREEVAGRHPGAEVVRQEQGFRFLVNGTPVAEIRWLNWQQDVGVGYDIEIIEGDRRECVEVKATSSEAKASFEITPTQWECARQNGPLYRICRVYNAGRGDARVEHYHDPFRMWQEGRLLARPIQIVL